MKDYASLIDFILDDPRNKLTDKATNLLKEVAKHLEFPKKDFKDNSLVLKKPEKIKKDWECLSEDELEDLRRKDDNYFRDKDGWFDNDC